jgi:hypothetical protein
MVEFTVTVPFGTGGGYYINGVQKPIVPVVTGGTFRFNQNHSSNNNHPLILSTTTSTGGIISSGVSYYLDGASNQANYTNTSLFNAATVRYIEITVAQTSDFYYLCNVHGSGMGNVMDVTSNTWSALTWNAGNWSDQNNINLTLTGINLTTSLNSVDAFPNEGWGSDRWGIENWGESGLNVTVTGNSLSTTVGGPAFGWGQSSWNSSELNWNGFSNVTVALGQQVDVTGIGLTVTLNSVTEIITVDAFLTGINLTTTLGTVDADPDASVTGIELTSSTGTLLGYNRQGWGRFYWGEEVWNGDGIAATATVTGQELTIVQGTVEASINALVNVSSVASVGWGVVGWGLQGWNASQEDIAMTINQGEVDPSPDATVTGIGMTCDLAIGTVIIGTANVDVTGTQLTLELGTASGEAITLVDVTGTALTLDLGTVFAGGNTEVDITGNILTITQNSASVQSWTKINTGTVVTWTEIDTAA